MEKVEKSFNYCKQPCRKIWLPIGKFRSIFNSLNEDLNNPIKYLRVMKRKIKSFFFEGSSLGTTFPVIEFERFCMEDSWEDRQKNEVQALQAIYVDDFEKVSLSEGSEDWKPPEFILHLKPSRGCLTEGKVHVKLDMRVSFSSAYPAVSPPTMILEKSEGISLKHLAELNKELNELAKTHTGQEMIFNLADYMQNRLADINQPQFGSFYEEMLYREQNKIEEVALQEKSKLELRQREDESMRQAFAEEIHRKQEALRSELLRNKEVDVGKVPWLKPEFIQKNRVHKDSASSEEEKVNPSDECCSHNKSNAGMVHFSNRDGGKMYRHVQCLGKCSAVRSLFLGVETSIGEVSVISHYSIKNISAESQKKQLLLLEQEFRALQKVRSRQLVPYTAFRAETLGNEANIFVASGFVLGLNMSFYLKQNIPVNADFLRHVSQGLVEGLVALHAANLVFKNLRDSSVFITNNGHILLAGYNFESRISELLGMQFVKAKERSFPQPPGRPGKKGDIHRLGILIWSLFQGELVTDGATKLSSRIPPLLRDFISKCTNEEERNRPNALDLLNHPFLKAPLAKPLLEREESTNQLSLPQPTATLATNASARLQSEFEILTFLGSGGFGDVLKVRNKLDGNIYAIKRIHLDAKSKQLNKKITREVKLLSRLNHENVVRYYNSWIETTQTEETHKKRRSQSSTADLSDEDSEEDTGSSSSSGSSLPSRRRALFVKPKNRDSSDGIEFEYEDDEEEEEELSENSSSSETAEDEVTAGRKPGSHELQYMYIQMEYCEKSTLRTAIDAELYKDKNRIWRLFREIVEGLAHIHQQGIIHRDLKPVNIFLDLNDHVKIGDFGLATSIVMMHKTPDVTDSSITEKSSEAASSSGALTGEIGTALYIAPELKMASGKLSYNEKVDTYSVGIIFFEMSYPPLATGMERYKILSGIRQPEILFPLNWSDFISSDQSHIIRWLLNHNPTLRPTSQELLQSDLLPPPQLEDAELQEMVRHTLSNPQSKAYKYLIASCFQQQTNIVEDVIYDMDLTASATSAAAHRSSVLSHIIQDTVAKHCQKRGAIPFNTPLLCPNRKGGSTAGGRAYLMTHSGAVVSLPLDLQTPFARYVARSNITWLKRYSIEKVYSERKIFGFHPKETLEAAFDIVTPVPGSPLADAEVLITVCDILHDSRMLSARSLTLYVNHTSLVKAVLVHCGIPEEKQADVCSVLHAWKLNKHLESQTVNRLTKLSIPKQTAENMICLLDLQGPLQKVSGSLRAITTRKGEAASLAKQALHELESILSRAEDMGLRYNPVLNMGLIFPGTSAKDQIFYSGIVFQFVYESQQRRLQRKKSGEVLARGGRYDALVSSFRNPFCGVAESSGNTAVVGALIALDKVVLAMEEVKSSEESHTVEVAIFAVGHQTLTKEKAALLKDLWTLGVKAITVDHLHTLEDAQSWCREKSIPSILLLKDTESGTVRFRSWEKDRYNERKLSLAEVLEMFQRNSRAGAENTDTRLENYGRSASISESGGTVATAIPSSAPGIPVPNLTFITEEKLPMNARKRYESLMLKHLQSVLQNFSARVQVEVVGVETSGGVVSSIAAALISTNSEPKAIEEATATLTDKHRKQRRYLERVLDQLFRMRFEKNVQILIIYGLHDNSHRLVM